jgi:hypothetical protein
MKNSTWREWSWCMKLLCIQREERKGIREPWLDIHKIKARVI